MRALHIIPSFGLGGMERVICSLINYTSHKYDHIILSLDGNYSASKWIKAKNFEPREFQKVRHFSKFLKRLHNELMSTSPNLVMTYGWGAMDAIWLGRLAGISSIIHHEHGFSVEEAYKTIGKRDICRLLVYRMASCLVTVSSDLKQSIQKKYRLNGEHVRMIPNGIDTHYYSPDPHERYKQRQELGFRDDDLVIVFSGRLDPVKNFDLLLEIFEFCHRLDCRFKLLIVGDGPERQKIERRRVEGNLHSGLLMVGQTLDVLPYLRAGDIFLLTSLTEQMPLTILEAMSVGLPVVASNVGEIRHMIDDGKDGFIRDTRDGCGGFAAALLELKDSSGRQTMGRAARSKIVARFQEGTMAQTYEALIDNVLGPQ